MTINGIDISESFGMSFLEQKGAFDLPKIKRPININTPDISGQYIDISQAKKEAKQISVTLLVKATSKDDYVIKVKQFQTLICGAGLHELVFDNISELFEVYVDGVVKVERLTNINKIPIVAKIIIPFVQPYIV